jgi:hypothetical protein
MTTFIVEQGPEHPQDLDPPQLGQTRRVPISGGGVLRDRGIGPAHAHRGGPGALSPTPQDLGVHLGGERPQSDEDRLHPT